ncbi:ImmA/IrrE family metallo-endopeptidase [Schleiferilactobacillus harbinensis]|jgi:hypothetical protein|uniref:ImmA/IrrE family metallo-endopeptidase n=1 Tax=Schleiferilactobacillus harbinensis TaxID=304207 RepID=A0A5P8M3B0_9LACO|nr:ImmA/IrrE family metallo-endopeptidase [Schleiferilactobacillus harbinensis]QFR22976.1 ImmA/IrrE family metallo-endopeptidase [Schleiferilactobacillus harbinensis]
MNDEYQELFSDVLNYAQMHGVGYILTDELQPDTPSQSKPASKMMLINLNWHDQKQLPFVAAHECGHILDGDQPSALYFTTFSSQSKYELHANQRAYEILLSLTMDSSTSIETVSVTDWMDKMHIPAWQEDNVRQAIKEHLA